MHKLSCKEMHTTCYLKTQIGWLPGTQFYQRCRKCLFVCLFLKQKHYVILGGYVFETCFVTSGIFRLLKHQLAVKGTKPFSCPWIVQKKIRLVQEMISDNTNILPSLPGEVLPLFFFSMPLSRNKSNTKMQMLKGTKMCLKYFPSVLEQWLLTAEGLLAC